MRSDLDRLMQQRGLAGLVVFAHDRYSPAFYYCTGQKIHHGIFLRSADGRAHLVVDPMERDQAAAALCEWSTYAQHGFLAMVKSAESQTLANAKLIAKLLGDLQLTGRIAFAGETSLGYAHAMLTALTHEAPGVAIDGSQPDVISMARETKEEWELEHIRQCSRAAVQAMANVRAYLASLTRAGSEFRDPHGAVAKLGHLRSTLHRTFAEHRVAEAGGDSIVAQGRDAGVPHNRGNDDEPVREGATIIVDIFPGEAGGGYHTDMTRTFVLGKASDAVKEIYAHTHEAFAAAMAAAKGGVLCRSLQDLACDVFEKHGHATLRVNESAQEGYVHSLGHGVGLAVHEGPRLGGNELNTSVLTPGHVVSIEPGLYYPSRGMGCRIEDLVAVRTDGSIENLTPAPYSLEVEPSA